MMNLCLGTLAGEREPAATDADWAAVYADHLPRIYGYFRFRTGDESLAEDLTAQTFERAWRERARYRRDLAAFSTWLFTLARRVGANHFRRRSVGPSLPLEWATALQDPGSLEEIVQRRSDLARLRVLLARLPSRERELIELKYGASLTNRAIAAMTGLSESNVGTLLHRAVRWLRVEWEEERA